VNTDPEGSGKTNPPAGEGNRISAPTISLPKGGGAIRGMGEKLAANPVTGTGSLSIPISTSSGRSGFGPQLSLAYDSGSGNGPFGLGWSLSLPSITRKTDKGLPRYEDAEESDVFILSGAEDLVPVLLPDGSRFKDNVSVAGYTIHRYRPRIEGLFARMERWTRNADGHMHWRSITRDNITTLYGRATESRIFDPADPTRIFSWLICESYDGKGNAIHYQYKAENSDGVDISAVNEKNRSRTAQRYIKRIKYGNKTPRQPSLELAQHADWMFEVVFDYGEHYPGDELITPSSVFAEEHERRWAVRQDPFSSYRAGFEVRTYRLCRRVLMFHHFPDELGINDYLVRATHLAISEDSAVSLITAVTQSGYVLKERDGAYLKKSLPPVEFEYSKANIDEAVREVEEDALENLPQGLDGSHYQWVDLDGEGLSGILTEQGGGWFYKRNLSALPVGGHDAQLKVAARFAPVECLGAIPSPANLAGGQQLLDLAGNGQLDVVEFDGTAPGFFERTRDDRWETLTMFASLPNLSWKDPNLRFVDLTGDGHADILIAENEVLTWYPSLAEEGFGRAEKLRQALDEEAGPRLVFADGTQSIYLSDFSGDGLTDLVRIRNGEVCYWPNLGYGRFGAKVTMADAPWFDAPDLFDQKRIRLADIDGSGVVDIIYLAADGVRLYFNQSGNGWSDARLLTNFPPVDNLSSVQTADLLGNGTACLVWSSPLPVNARRPMRYIHLMGGQKPHLLIKTVNNLGAETEVQYAPSTKFYLADKFAGRPWITKLPFPVHCVEKVTVTDKWRNTRFASTYSYHHGYFDGAEREFRGFGRVEQVDVESFGEFAAGNSDSPYITADRKLYQPPVKTITWFHTGAALDRRRILTQLQAEYFPNSLAAMPGYSSILTGFNEKPLPEPDMESQDLSDDEWREALRACKGVTLRQEVYELDVDELERGRQIPVRLFSTASHNCDIRRLQPKGGNHHAVFLTTESEALSYHYGLELRSVTFPTERTRIEPLEPDPRVAHTLNLSFDEYGNIQQSIAVGYKRARAFTDSELNPHLGLINEVQGEQHLAYTETRYTNDAIEPETGTAIIQHHRLRLPYEVRTYELTGLIPAGGFYFELSELRGYHWSDALLNQGSAVVGELEYEGLPSPGAVEKRKVEHALTLFFSDDLKTPLGHGQLNRLGITFESYKLALTGHLLRAVLGSKFDGAVQSAIDTPATSGYWQGTRLLGMAGADQWWVRSGVAGFVDDVAGFADDAAQHFYLPERYTDPFGNKTTLSYDDKYDLFIESSTDALGNHTRIFVDSDPRAGVRFDYRVLAPAEIEDINGNRTEVYFDALGMVVAVAVKGKGAEADNLIGYDDEFANPNLAALLNHFDLPPLTIDEARGRFSPMLGNATSRFLYHFGEKIEDGKTVWASRPAGACAIVREQHVAYVEKLRLTEPATTSPLQIAFECSDGAGTVLMKRSQAEPESTDSHLRWIVSGKTVLNNKGKPVKQYEPYFSSRASCCAEGYEHEEAGVTPLMYYDAAGRLVRTEMPDGTFSRVEFSPWHVRSFDQNDTVKESRWYRERHPPPIEEALPRDPLTHALSVTADERAAWLAAQHADTPALTILDSLGRDVIAIAHNRVEDGTRAGLLVFDGKHYRDERQLTFTKLDAEGKPLWIRDARGNLVMQYITPPVPNNQASERPSGFVPCYDIAGNLLFEHSMDSGDRWTLMDAAGKPMLTWDFNERQHATGAPVPEQRAFSTRYDALHRPVEHWLTVNAESPKLIERFTYGESLRDAAERNLLGQLHEHYDMSGVVVQVRHDFKGNPLEIQRRLARTFDAPVIDWSTGLEDETFARITEYDALNRMARQFNWHKVMEDSRVRVDSRVAVYEPRYNARGLLAGELLFIRAVKTASGYEGGQRTSAIHSIVYDAKGQKERIDYGNDAVTRYDYDPLTFRLRQLRTTRPGSDTGFPGHHSGLIDENVLQQLHYTYDPAGNITEVYDEAYEPLFFRNQTVESRSRYAYDALYRLTEANGREHAGVIDAPGQFQNDQSHTGFPIPGREALRNYTQHYRYDAVGNIEQMRHVAAPTGSWTRRYTYAADSNRLMRTWEGSERWEDAAATNKVTYRYDTHGSMLNLADVPAANQLRWDYRDMIQSVNRGGGGWAYYNYDATKERTHKLVTNEAGVKQWERFYLGGMEVYRRYVAGELVDEIETHHLFVGEQRALIVEDVLVTSDASLGVGTRFRYQYGNHLGSACVELDENGALITYEEYHPYGTSAYQAGRSAAEVSLKRYRYAGKERDEETGLNYHSARYYAPWMGRWISGDPSGTMDGTNLYCFVRNSPITFSDPFGKQAAPAQNIVIQEEWSISVRRHGHTHVIASGSERREETPASSPRANAANIPTSASAGNTDVTPAIEQTARPSTQGATHVLIAVTGYHDSTDDEMFRAAMYTRATDIANSPDYSAGRDRIVTQEIQDISRIRELMTGVSQQNNARNQDTIEVGVYSHGGYDGPVGSQVTSHNQLDDRSGNAQMTLEGWREIQYDWAASGGRLVFYGCNTGNTNETHQQSFANQISRQPDVSGVEVSGQTASSFPSRYANSRETTVGRELFGYSNTDTVYMVGGNNREGPGLLFFQYDARPFQVNQNGTAVRREFQPGGNARDYSTVRLLMTTGPFIPR
jgi:RHS repeat-associated protein